MTNTHTTPAQNFVPIKDIREDVVLLKGGGYRGVLMCSSINFELKSSDEQKAIIRGFQTFLNTLDFPVQIVMQSRRIDIKPYLELLGEKEKNQQTELLRMQLREYILFIKNLTEKINIMTKSFYIVVPYTSGNSGEIKHIFSGLLGNKVDDENKTTKTAAQKMFEEARTQLQQRMSLVTSSISATGVRAVTLGTEELIELFFRSFNPGEVDDPIRLS